MRKSITKIICVATAAISALGVCFAAGCGANWQGVSKDDSFNEVSSNGGFLVETGKYAYFVNGVESNTADNTYGSVLKGSVQRISKQDLSDRNYASTQTVVPEIAYSANNNAGIFVYGEYIYYATPSTSMNSDGVVQNSKIEFRRSKLDGTDRMNDYFYSAPSTSLDYRYVEVDGTVYLMYAQAESLYGEASNVTNVHSVNTSDGTDTILAYNVAAYNFDTEDPTDPYVFYTMGVTDNLGSENSVTESYNQLYVARADATQSLKDYDFTYVEDYDAEADPLYINRGSYVLDGIGVVEYGSEEDNRRNQFNFGYENGMAGYSIGYTGCTYKAVSFKNGVLQFTVTQRGDTSGALCRINVSELDKDGDGKVDSGWDAIDANKTVKDAAHLILNVSDSKEYIFVNVNGTEKVMYAGSNGIELGEIKDGEVKDSYPITSGGAPTFLAVREETTAAENGTGTSKHLYVYYSITGGNGYTVYRIAIDGSIDSYATNKLPYEDVYTYSEVRVLDIDAVSSWYKPEFVDNQILFASETTGMTSYNYVMACDLRSEDGDMLSNAELNAYDEKLSAVFDKINGYDEEKNSTGTAAYEHLSSALKYLFYTGEENYLDELIQAYVDVEDRSEEYLYSKESAAIYKDFAKAEGDWADYVTDNKQVNGKYVYANNSEYYYSVVGRMSDADAENRLVGLKASYMQTYPIDDTTWWEGLSTVAKVFFIIGMCAAGIIVIGGIILLVVMIVRKKKSEQADEDNSKSKIDITDDRNIDVYSDEEK